MCRASPREHYAALDGTNSANSSKHWRQTIPMTLPGFLLILLTTIAPPSTAAVLSTPAGPPPLFEWSSLPSIPDPPTGGSFGGLAGDRILLIGGSHFPQPEWSGEKRWSDRIISLTPSDHDPAWSEESTRLPHPLGYGWVAVQFSLGTIPKLT